MNLSRFSVANPVPVNLLMVLVLVAGVFAFVDIPKEEWPQNQLNTVTVTTDWVGASPAEVEALITRPIEEEIDGLDDIESIFSFSSEGRSVVNVRFDAGVDDMARKVQEVQTEVNKVDDLPADAEDPEVEEWTMRFRLLTICLTIPHSEQQIAAAAEDLQYALQNVYGVDHVELQGHRDREVHLAVDPTRLEQFGLTFNDLVTAVRRKHLNLPAGTLKLPQREYIVRTVGEAPAIASIGEIVVRQDPAGGHVTVADVARVSDGFADHRVIARIDGQRCISLSVYQQSQGNIVDVVARVKEIAARFQESLPAGSRIVFANDNSVYLEKRLGILYSNGLSGFVLVILCLMACIGLRPALVTALGMPVAFCGTLLLMQVAGITINSLSLFAMIVVLGMIVDDAIVVTENVYRYIEQGMPVREAAVLGAQEVFWPVTAAVATTMAAFLPMLLMTGPMGVFMATVPKVVIFALAASLWEAFLVLPCHIADLARPPRTALNGARRGWLGALERRYVQVLERFLRHRYRAVALLVVVSAAVVVVAVGTMGFVLFPNPEFDTLYLRTVTPASSTVEETEQVTARAERVVLTLPPDELMSVDSTVGRKLADLGSKDGGYEYGSNIEISEIRLTDPRVRQRSGDAILADLRGRLQQLPDADCYRLEAMRAGPPVGKPVAVRVMGDAFEELQQIAGRVGSELARIPGVVDIRDDFLPGKQELRIRIKHDRAALYGVDVETVARTVQCAYMGCTAAEYTSDNDEVDIVVRLDRPYRQQMQMLAQLRIAGRGGVQIPLREVADIEQAAGWSKIRRYDRMRVINVTADIQPGQNTTSQVIARLRARMAPVMAGYPGYSLRFGGEFEDTQRSLQSLFRAFGLAVFLIYLILATVFKSFVQPFMLMLSIPFAILGVVVGLLVMRTPLGMMSFLGLIALAGIVVNDAIVLIDFINRSRGSGPVSISQVVDACRLRLRPVLLTSATTIAGLLPISLGLFGREFMMTPMAISIVWGLTLSSGLTLLIIPCFYLMVEDLAGLFGRRRN